MLLSTALDPPREADVAGVAPVVMSGFSSLALPESVFWWLAGARVRWPDMLSMSEIGHERAGAGRWEHGEDPGEASISSRCRPSMRSAPPKVETDSGYFLDLLEPQEA